jgi:hypothetical protein
MWTLKHYCFLDKFFHFLGLDMKIWKIESIFCEEMALIQQNS